MLHLKHWYQLGQGNPSLGITRGLAELHAVYNTHVCSPKLKMWDLSQRHLLHFHFHSGALPLTYTMTMTLQLGYRNMYIWQQLAKHIHVHVNGRFTFRLWLIVKHSAQVTWHVPVQVHWSATLQKACNCSDGPHPDRSFSWQSILDLIVYLICYFTQFAYM